MLLTAFVCALLVGFAAATNSTKQARVLSAFHIVRFANSPCASASPGRNGTCYTADECNSFGGSSSGTCASSFGVCCIFSLSCGGSSSQNCTYIVQSSTSSLTSNPCTYTICKSSSDICRIKFDFSTFIIANPQAGTTAAEADTLTSVGESTGDCLTDKFSIASPGNTGSPVICGVNSGQHIFVDAADSCHKASFFLSTSDTTSRSWDIKVTQYLCGDTRAGNDGCLQYFTGESGTVSSISNIADSAAQETNCLLDYIVIRNAVDINPTTPLTVGTIAAAAAGRICGRAFSTASTSTATIATATATRVSVCTQTTPFIIDVNFDSTEVTTAMTFATNEHALEDAANMGVAGGIIGFSLNYIQRAC